MRRRNGKGGTRKGTGSGRHSAAAQPVFDRHATDRRPALDRCQAAQPGKRPALSRRSAGARPVLSRFAAGREEVSRPVRRRGREREVPAGQIQPASVAMRMASTRFLAFSLVTIFVR